MRTRINKAQITYCMFVMATLLFIAFVALVLP